MNRDPDERAQPEGGPAPDDFDAIVAGWAREGEVPVWPEDDGPLDEPAAEATPADDGPGAGALFAPDPLPQPLPPAEEDHFVPPEPPPLPRLGPPAMVGIGLLCLGLVLIITPGWVGVPNSYGLPLGLVSLAAGLGWLVLRLWPDSEPVGDGDGEDDGAVI